MRPMRPSLATAVALLGTVVASVGGVGEAQALTACTAAQITSQDPGCPPGTGACNITRIFDIGDGCTIDLAVRNVTLTGSGRINIFSGTVVLKAGTVTLAQSSLIDGKGNLTTTPRNRGGMITIQTTGAFTTQRGAAGNGIIDVSGMAQGGTIVIDAGGSVTHAGRLIADQLDPNGSGGSISIRSKGDVVTNLNSLLTATGGLFGGGGAIDISATGRIDLAEMVNGNGGDGGLVDLLAGGEIITRRIEVIGQGDAGSGGCVSIVAGTRVQLLQPILGNGTASSTASGGGCGGFLDVEARFGDVNVTANLNFDSGYPDGGGGGITLTSRGSITVSSVAIVSAAGVGPFGCGGEISMDANVDVISAGTLDGTGGFGGNLVDVIAGRNASVTGPTDVRGRESGSFGGAVTALAGALGPGTLTIGNSVKASGGGCAPETGCGVGGFADLSGCDVTVTPAGSVEARGGDAGEILITAREQLRVQGPLDATTVGGGANGSNIYVHKSTKAPIVTAAVSPPATATPLAACTAPAQPACLIPCPGCGNGVIEFPEACDTVGTPQSCDGGCSTVCQLENCNDGSPCTVDTCDPLLGCRHAPAPDGTSCSDSNVCNGVEQCTGIFCQATAPLNCNDSNPCTLDPCNPVSGCSSHPPAPASTACSDNNLCTLGDACNGTGACNPGPFPLICNDNLECTTDTCAAATGCVFTQRTGACTDDGSECTTDTCAAGVCTHPARTGACTDDGNECTTDTCAAGACTHPPRTGSCTDDGNACTSDTCAGGACTHPARTNGTPCDDGGFCTVNDSCQGGVCTGGGARPCGDTDVCTTDGCDELGDTCTHTPLNPCCGNGTPEAGEACDDGNGSNSDACLTTCVAASCGDGFVRTGVEQCDLGGSNSNAPNANCRTDCRLQRCGDGVVDNLRGEQCDDGNTSNGDGCSATCFQEPPPSGDFIAGRGNSTTDCALEWAMVNPDLDRNGIPWIRQSCQDGDPSCDVGTTPGECTFHVWICSNNHDARLPLCTPGGPALGTILSATALKPSQREAGLRAEDAANRLELLRAAQAAQVSTFDTCGPRMAIRVPLKTPDRKGVKTLRVKGGTSIGIKEVDVLKLFCLP